MGLFDFLFPKHHKIEHDFFGTMLFVANKKEPSKNYFECRRPFIPYGMNIEIGIEGDESGPTIEQIDFYKEIEYRFVEITNSIQPLIENEVNNWLNNYRIADFQKEFKAVYLSLSRCKSKPVLWEISFEAALEGLHTFTIKMVDFEANSIHLEG